MPLFRAMLLSLLLAAGVSADSIRVGAAISLKDAISEIAKTYESATSDHVEFIFGSSGQILAQIKSGADIDLFISAANKQVDDLEKDKLVDAASRMVVVGNTLVLVVPADAKESPADFEALKQAGVSRIAIGEPRTVPAGQYAQQVFKSLNLTDALANKLVYGTNVRQVLTYVERGEVSAGVVYATDAKMSGERVRVVATADVKSHEPIVCPGVVVSASQKQEAARRFLKYVAEPPAQAAFAAKGFKPAGSAAAASPVK